MNFFKKNLLAAVIQSALSNSTPNRINREIHTTLDACWIVYGSKYHGE